ncbi:helix-turn-helix transcriptional regulator [Candidatus Woesearchaeota archaeon]|nr:helix-turn-helix transcriptional regulator [Candidatus Woesearchaeota archaeon]
MSKGEALAQLVDGKKAAILKILFNSKEELCLNEVAAKSNVSVTSTFRILQELASAGLVKRREWKHSKVYFPEDNERVAFLKELFYEEYDGLQEFVNSVGSLPNLQSIISYGPKKKDKASVMIIGEGIDMGKVNEVCQKLKENGFELTILTLTKSQYDQMTRMGLYSGDKKVLK